MKIAALILCEIILAWLYILIFHREKIGQALRKELPQLSIMAFYLIVFGTVMDIIILSVTF